MEYLNHCSPIDYWHLETIQCAVKMYSFREDRNNCTNHATSSQRGRPLAHTISSNTDIYHTYRPYHNLNQSVYATPSECVNSYQMNRTIHVCEKIDDSFHDISCSQKKKKSRVRIALKELLGKSFRRDSAVDLCGRSAHRSELPKKCHDSVANSRIRYAKVASENAYCARKVDSREDFLLALEFQRDRVRRRNRGPIKLDSSVASKPIEIAKNRKSSDDAFVNSHEWTLSRSVSELRLTSTVLVIIGSAAGLQIRGDVW
ncbi:hypothetical protein DICVIV_03608 [Dictyocaulus viviparus]|uniref:Uncharacterized protein n=1 Tax=Dictyocaulus viviparus TaxID=29172 RepID=A0A0D8Y2K7_DICVI|nr:hypothetical protein DICVIV_03608 [Dictyocaulus viviparus]